MCGASAEMQRQYGSLGCARPVGLRMQLFPSCVQSVGSFGRDVWGVPPLTGDAKQQRAAIVTLSSGHGEGACWPAQDHAHKRCACRAGWDAPGQCLADERC